MKRKIPYDIAIDSVRQVLADDAAGSANAFRWQYESGSSLKSKLTYPNGLTANWSYDMLRNLRLDVRVDERGLCDHCRMQLKVPDGGRIVHIPEDWPEREKVGDFPNW